MHLLLAIHEILPIRKTFEDDTSSLQFSSWHKCNKLIERNMHTCPYVQHYMYRVYVSTISIFQQITSIQMSRVGPSHPWVWIGGSTASPTFGFLCRAPENDSSPLTVYIQHLHQGVSTSLHPAWVPPFCHQRGVHIQDCSASALIAIQFHKKSQFPFVALWRPLSFDLSDSLVVLDQYFQQFVSPVKSISKLA